MKLFDIKGKNAIITGGNRGLGKQMAIGFGQAGVNVAIIDMKVDSETVESVKEQGVNCIGYDYDLSDFESYDSLVEKIKNDFGSIDILVNNAGIQRRHDSVEFPKSDWDDLMNINCNAVFFLCQKVGNIMIEQGKGKIINIASLLSFQGGFRVPAYTASKSAVMGFSKALSNEWASLGVNVNCIAPGYMDTDMNTALINDENRNRQILERIPAGRWGKHDEIVGTAIYLASPASDYVNGFTIAVDGGWLGR